MKCPQCGHDLTNEARTPQVASDLSYVTVLIDCKEGCGAELEAYYPLEEVDVCKEES